MWVDCSDAVLFAVLKYVTVFSVVLKLFRKIRISTGGKVEKNEMGVACGAYAGGERCAQGSGGETGGK